MAWTVGRFLVAPGESVRLEFTWQGAYRGVQFAFGKPVMDLGAFLPAVYGEREVTTTERTLRARRASPDRPIEWIYGMTVKNTNSEFAVFFDLTGGQVEP